MFFYYSVVAYYYVVGAGARTIFELLLACDLSAGKAAAQCWKVEAIVSQQVSAAEVERMMKVQEVILKASASLTFL
jgi:hypothetical protein